MLLLMIAGLIIVSLLPLIAPGPWSPAVLLADDKMNRLDLLTLICGLSVYVATVRLAVVARLGSDKRPNNPAASKFFVLGLIPADLNLMVSGGCLIATMFYAKYFAEPTKVWLASFIAPSFVFAVGYLMVLHVVGWVVGLRSFLKE